MRRLLVCQHVAHEILGTLDPLLRESGCRIRYVNFGREPLAEPRIDRYDALIVLGGPMNCDEVDRYPHLATEVELIRETLRQDKPLLGICLGSQLLARALGARVGPNPVKEIGWYPLRPTAAAAGDGLFRHLSPNQSIFQWHGDTFDIPDGAVHLARSPDCENQAFRYGDKVYGLQFHLEVDEPMINRWLHTPSNARDLAALGGSPWIERIQEDTRQHVDDSLALGARVFGGFIDLFGNRRLRAPLPSR